MREEHELSTAPWEKIQAVGAAAVRTYATADGRLLLARGCLPALVEQLRADAGLRAFARLPEREYQLLLQIARQPQSSLTLAYTCTGEIVGQVSLAPAGSWWQGIPVCEVAIEVSTAWRRRGIAHQLLQDALNRQSLEHSVIVGLGLSWHWDCAEAGLSRFAYRAMLEQLFAPYGFSAYLTSEPNIRMDPANIFLARLGSQLGAESVARFFQCLLQSETLPGL